MITENLTQEGAEATERNFSSNSRILISGASGLIGSVLKRYLITEGFEVRQLSRRPGPDSILWNPKDRQIEKEKLSGFDALINLAGENIAARRWTPKFKRQLYDSRVASTNFLIESLAGSGAFPKVVISASAVGFYGETGEEEISEDHPFGCGFLAEICRDWEASAEAAGKYGARVVLVRLGVVLDSRGGALAKMLPVFKLGLGGRVGSGRQWMSWISSADLCSAIKFVIQNESVSGSVNLCSPNPVRNMEFSKTLGAALGRPAILPLPAFMARLMFGELADETLLRSTRALPRKLLKNGFIFDHAELGEALRGLPGMY